MKRLPTTVICALLLGASASAATGRQTPAAAKSSAPTRAVAKPATAKVAAANVAAAKPGAAKAAAAGSATATPEAGKSDSDDGMTMRGGQEGTVFRSLTVEGEDRIRLEFERPPLRVDLDPNQAPGLDWGSARDVLDRTLPDLAGPLMARSAFEPSPYVGHPWLTHFATGAVARFRPDVKSVESWKLTVVNARGVAVATFAGRGEPPREITWDGRAQDGTPVVPGLTYSYVFEAHDRAGNKRNFVGQGFRVSAYRLDGAEGPTLVLSARELPAVAPGRTTDDTATPPILCEAASWLNQAPRPDQPVQVTVTTATYEQARAFADQITRWMAPYLVGDPARVRAVASVAADAPEGGTITIAPTR
jgi:hypothetical protein